MKNISFTKTVLLPALVFLAFLYIRTSLDEIQLKPFVTLTAIYILCVELRCFLKRRKGGISNAFTIRDLALLPLICLYAFPAFVILQSVRATPILLAFAPALTLCFWGFKAPRLNTPAGLFRNTWLPLLLFALICAWWLGYNQAIRPECDSSLKDGCPGMRWINFNDGRNFLNLIPDSDYLFSLKALESYMDVITVSGPAALRYPNTPPARLPFGSGASAFDSRRNLILVSDPAIGWVTVLKKSNLTKTASFEHNSYWPSYNRNYSCAMTYSKKRDMIIIISDRKEISLFSADNYKHIKTYIIPSPPGYELFFDGYFFSLLHTGDNLIIGTWAGEILEFSLEKRKLTKRKWLGMPVQYTSSDRLGKNIYAVTLGKRLYTLDPKDLSVKKMIRLPSGARSAIVWPEQNRVFTQSYFDGYIYMLSSIDGKIIDKKNVGGGNGSLQIDYKNNIIYIGTKCGVFGLRFGKNGFYAKPSPAQCEADSKDIRWQKMFYPPHSLQHLPVTNLTTDSMLIYLYMLKSSLIKLLSDFETICFLLFFSFFTTRYIAAGARTKNTGKSG